MKKTIAGTFVAVFLALGLTLVSATPALAADTILGISGDVTDKDTGKPVAGALVQVICGDVLIYYATTDRDGHYNVPAENVIKCKVGGPLAVTGVMGDKSTSYTEPKTTADNIYIIDLKLVKEITAPEYDWLGGIFAGSTTISIIAFVRRRNVSI